MREFLILAMYLLRTFYIYSPILFSHCELYLKNKFLIHFPIRVPLCVHPIATWQRNNLRKNSYPLYHSLPLVHVWFCSIAREGDTRRPVYIISMACALQDDTKGGVEVDFQCFLNPSLSMSSINGMRRSKWQWLVHGALRGPLN